LISHSLHLTHFDASELRLRFSARLDSIPVTDKLDSVVSRAHRAIPPELLALFGQPKHSLLAHQNTGFVKDNSAAVAMTECHLTAPGLFSRFWIRGSIFGICFCRVRRFHTMR
jgi:hypothetical protein